MLHVQVLPRPISVERTRHLPYALQNWTFSSYALQRQLAHPSILIAENGGTSREVNARIQKARGSFSKLRKLWLSNLLRKDTKIRIFNACVKSVLLYGCETWLVTKEIQRKIQTFVNRCLMYILRIWWSNIISNKDLWKVTGQEDINLEIRKRKFSWIGHTLRKEDAEIPKAALLWNPQGNRKRGRPRNSWRRSVIKEAGRSWNELRF